MDRAMCFGVVISLICRRSFSGQQAPERAPELWGREGGESYRLETMRP